MSAKQYRLVGTFTPEMHQPLSSKPVVVFSMGEPLKPASPQPQCILPICPIGSITASTLFPPRKNPECAGETFCHTTREGRLCKWWPAMVSIVVFWELCCIILSAFLSALGQGLTAERAKMGSYSENANCAETGCTEEKKERLASL